MGWVREKVLANGAAIGFYAVNQVTMDLPRHKMIISYRGYKDEATCDAGAPPIANFHIELEIPTEEFKNTVKNYAEYFVQTAQASGTDNE